MTVYMLWSSPRSRSTAFFRSMVERGDVTAAHEPFFDIHAFGRTEIDGTVFTSIEELASGLGAGAVGGSVFIKETTDHRYEPVFHDRRFLAEVHHAFLIRRPEEIAASYHALYPEMRRHEIGLEALDELYRAVVDTGGHRPVVIDSDDLIARPEAVMAAYCAAVELPFLPEALTWTPEDRWEWRRTARWHRSTASSSGFEDRCRHYDHTVEEQAKLSRFAAHHRPFYERLRARRLRVDRGQRGTGQVD